MSARADITIIALWPIEFTCQRCDMRHSDKLGWSYYEDFIIGEPAWWQELGGYVPVCKCCYLELLAAEAVA
jgi:hypothetical protein